MLRLRAKGRLVISFVRCTSNTNISASPITLVRSALLFGVVQTCYDALRIIERRSLTEDDKEVIFVFTVFREDDSDNNVLEKLTNVDATESEFANEVLIS